LKTVQTAAHIVETQEKKPEAAKTEIPVDIVKTQKLLAERGLEVPQSGKLDNATKGALRQLEKQLDVDLRRDPKLAKILEQKKWIVPGRLLNQDGMVADYETLRRLIALADRASGKSVE
jgi:hypothetical protein